MILQALSGFGFGKLLGNHKGFFNVAGELIIGDSVELLPRKQIIIELLESVEITDEIVDRCVELKSKGFSLLCILMARERLVVLFWKPPQYAAG